MSTHVGCNDYIGLIVLYALSVFSSFELALACQEFYFCLMESVRETLFLIDLNFFGLSTCLNVEGIITIWYFDT